MVLVATSACRKFFVFVAKNLTFNRYIIYICIYDILYVSHNHVIPAFKVLFFNVFRIHMTRRLRFLIRHEHITRTLCHLSFLGVIIRKFVVLLMW